MEMASLISILDKALIYVIINSRKFSVQDLLIAPPQRKECPNFKVKYIFKWIQYIYIKS